MATKKAAPLARRPMPNLMYGDGAAIKTPSLAPKSATNYFADSNAKTELVFVSSGCALLDAALGGGWAIGRCINIVGDKSAGKTLLAMEMAANFAAQFTADESWIRYAESEAAFDKPYAGALGIPLDRIHFNDKASQPLKTIEDLYDDLVRYLDKYKDKKCGLYIIDSLDALSDEAELKREFSEGSYGGTKPKEIGKLFRLLIDRMEEQGVMFVVVSQIRDKLNVTFGETKTRSGGRALDFYASHIVWIAEVQKLKKTRDKIERIIGVQVKANVKKNKVGLPFRTCEYPILFGYGIDDLTANLEWLIEVGRESELSALGFSKAGYKTRVGNLRDKGGPEMRAIRREVATVVHRIWAEIETGFLPTSRKY